MGRAASPKCVHCGHVKDDVEHTLFVCDFFAGSRVELEERLGHRPSAADMTELLCGPVFEVLPANQDEKSMLLSKAEEDFRQLYRMVEAILTTKEAEERTRQEMEGRFPAAR